MVDRVIGTKEVLRVSGDISTVTLSRWQKELGFPKPFKVGTWKNGWWENEVLAWLRNRAGGSSTS